jgi:predicted nucleotidyltransferase
MPNKIDFITPTTIVVLEFFLARPMSEFHEREVLRGTGISKGSANYILRRLATLSILLRTKKGRMVFYRLNAGDPFVKQIKIASNVWTLRPIIDELKKTSKKVILFGSCAEGTDVADSDIDVLILTGDKKTAKDKISAFNRQSEKPLAPIILSIEEFAAMRKEDKPLFERIDRGIILWEMA